MANDRSDTEFAPAALKWLADLPKEDRRELFVLLAEASRQPGAAAIGFVVVEALPGQEVARIVQDPNRAHRRFVVFSNRSYTDAAFAMVAQALGNREAATAIAGQRQVRVMTGGRLLDADSTVLFELRPPPSELERTSESLGHLKAAAVSQEPIEIPSLGKGSLYRFY